MKNLAEFAQDRHARKVLLALEDRIAQTEKDPLLRKLASGEASLREFGFITKVRLNAATNFIPFLSATEEIMRKNGGWNNMALALRENLDEELGIENEGYNPESDHEVWRERFRQGIEKALGGENILLQDIDDSDTSYDIGVFYGGKLKEMPTNCSVSMLAGGFTVLEGILEKEFAAMLMYIRTKLKGALSPDELTYITHHAGHEHRHLQEAAIPLLKHCTASPHIIPDVLDGIYAMQRLRLGNVLRRIDMNLWKAEPKK